MPCFQWFAAYNVSGMAKQRILMSYSKWLSFNELQSAEKWSKGAFYSPKVGK